MLSSILYGQGNTILYTTLYSTLYGIIGCFRARKLLIPGWFRDGSDIDPGASAGYENGVWG